MLRYILLFSFVFSLISVNAQFDIKEYDKLIKNGKKSLKKEYFSLAIDDFEAAIAMIEEPEAYNSEAYYSLADAQMKSELYDAAYGNFETSLRLGEGLLEEDFIEATKALMNTCLEMSGGLTSSNDAMEDNLDEEEDDMDDDFLADEDDDFLDDEDEMEDDLEDDEDEAFLDDADDDMNLDESESAMNTNESDMDDSIEDSEEEDDMFEDETSTEEVSSEDASTNIIDQIDPEFISSININTDHEGLQSILDSESEGLTFKVQVGAFGSRVSTSGAYFQSIDDPIAAKQLSNGIFIYTVGSYNTIAAANAKRASLSSGYPDAFIIAIYDDERADIKKVIELLAQ